jgi:PAS domain S-box-containing protein
MNGRDAAVLLQDLADAVVIANPAGTITFWNRSATRLFGWPATEAVGASLDLIIPERLRRRHWAGYQRVMQSGHTAYGSELLQVPALHRDGHTLSIAFTVTLLLDTDRRVAGIAAVLRDESDRWQQRKSLLEELATYRNSGTAATEP